MRALTVAALLALLALSTPATAQQDVGAGGVELRGLDKFSGVTSSFTAPVGAAVSWARLIVRAQSCQPRGGEGASAYLEIWDSKAPQDRIFAGWMLSDVPSVAALDHPRYDVWVLACSTNSGDAS